MINDKIKSMENIHDLYTECVDSKMWSNETFFFKLEIS